ncbi:HNH endonuclease family protein [Brucella lupini]|uniref:HNH endonuclease family protein n=1 Tax=Brucella lupini TaxID=255457 RepID=UPI001F1B6A17|nr:HNH endonuclease family protein [Brucella lupini]
MERLSYYLLVTKAGINSRIEHFVVVIEEIEKEEFDGFSESMASLGLDDDEKKSFIAALDGDIYKKLPKARAALILRLEALKSDGSKRLEFTNVSIEHILPQTPSEESGWLDIFADTELREDWTQRLANLVPLHIRKNPAASNFDFETKKNVYFAGNDGTASPFVLTQEVRSLPAWTPEVLEDRQQKLLDIFIRHWGLQLTEQQEF